MNETVARSPSLHCQHYRAIPHSGLSSLRLSCLEFVGDTMRSRSARNNSVMTSKVRASWHCAEIECFHFTFRQIANDLRPDAPLLPQQRARSVIHCVAEAAYKRRNLQGELGSSHQVISLRVCNRTPTRRMCPSPKQNSSISTDQALAFPAVAHSTAIFSF